MTNAEKLREYKAVYGLTTEKVAKILGCADITVRRWLYSPDTPHFKPMPDHRLENLKFKLRGRKKA